jgi:hypothetical protein
VREAGVASIAICFLFSYLDPSHEERARHRAGGDPDCFVTTSFSVSPQFREFERFTTTAINAFVGPKVRSYVADLETDKIQGFGRAQGRPSHHGLERRRGDRRHGVGTPGADAAERARRGRARRRLVGRAVGRDSLITFDVGGTSADIGIVVEGRFAEATPRDTWIAGFPLMVPMIDIHTIGAGGGSIAYRDAGGAFRVGPRSAGARPGPAAYGHGGTEPTVTDANLVLGRLDPDNFLGGEMRLDAAAAARAPSRAWPRQLGLDPMATAEGILTIVNSNMANAIRSRTVQKGLDPRDFSLVAFGGGGPLQVADVAAMLSIPEVIVPHYPGITSAMGLLTTDLKYDAIRTAFQVSGAIDHARIDRSLQGDGNGARRPVRRRRHRRRRRWRSSAPPTCAMSGRAMSCASRRAGPFDAAAERDLFAAFEERHRVEYGHVFPDSAKEIVNVRVTGLGATPKITRCHGPRRHRSRRRWCATGAACSASTIGAAHLRHRLLSPRPAAGGGRDRRPGDHPAAGFHHRGAPGRHLPGRRQRQHHHRHYLLSRRDRPDEPCHEATPGDRPGHRQRHPGRAAEHRHRDGLQAHAHVLFLDHPRIGGFRRRAGRRTGPPAGRIAAVDAAAVGADPRLCAERAGGDGAPRRDLPPGDVIMHNDPYGGASHGPDVAFIVPVFFAERTDRVLLHHGASPRHRGLSPGSCGIVDALDVYAEGLQFKAIKVL